VLRISKLTKRYSSQDLALTGVDLTVQPGEVVALIGPSGAGKSTLIRCVNRLVEPTEGTIELDGVDIVKLSGRELYTVRRRIGMIFQEFALVERLTVMENVLSGRLGYVSFWRSLFRRFGTEDVSRAVELLDRVGLVEHLDKRADQLSGGQRQRVGIARALQQTPSLLLIDEPTASLDPKTSRQIMRLIIEICSEQQLPAIINIHDVPLAMSFVSRVVGLKAGQKVYDGSPQNLTPDVLSDIYGDEDWSQMTASSEESAPTGVVLEPQVDLQRAI
jgi:phosphonate transport system ATP-binding protein